MCLPMSVILMKGISLEIEQKTLSKFVEICRMPKSFKHFFENTLLGVVWKSIG